MHKVSEYGLAWLKERIEGLNKRAAKLGLPPITVSVAGWQEEQEPHDLLPWVTVRRRYALVEVAGQAPKIAGWSLVAVAEGSPLGNVLRLVPGVESIPAYFRTAPMACDHCRVQRWRKEVFILRHDDGRFIQVGRQCLADFLGHPSPEALVGLAELLLEAESVAYDAESEWYSYGAGAPYTVPTLVYLSAVAAFSRCYGFVSRKRAELEHKEATADTAWEYLLPATDEFVRSWKARLAAEGFAVEERDTELARKALAWAGTLNGPDVSDFEWNLYVVAQNEHTDGGNRGILAALIGAYLRHEQKQAEEQARRDAARQRGLRHLGTVGERGVFDGITVTGWREFDGDYGVRTKVSMMDADGNRLVWWTGLRPNWVDESHDEKKPLRLKATVKAHAEYQGEPETVVSRVVAL